MANEVDTPVSALTSFQEWSAAGDDAVVVSSATEIDTAAETEPASEPETKVEEKEERLPKGLKKRFSELTSEIRELRTQLAAKPKADESGAATLPKETAKAVDAAGKPVAANFTTYEEYVEALTDWKLEARDALKAAVDAKANQAQIVKTQVEAARAKHDDYDAVVNDQVAISPAMAEVMIASDHGAEVAYYLGSNPDECARIGKLTPARAGAELAKIEASLNLEPSTSTTKPKAATSKAPTPPKTLTGSGGNADAEPDPKSFAAWNKWADREEKRRRGDD